MRNPPFRLASLALALVVAARLSAQTVADNTAQPAAIQPEFAPAAGSSTSSAALARQFTVTRQFTSDGDAATIHALRGRVSYQVYVRATADAPWKLVRSEDTLADEARLHFPGAHEIKIMLTTECADCVSVSFAR